MKSTPQKLQRYSQQSHSQKNFLLARQLPHKRASIKPGQRARSLLHNAQKSRCSRAAAAAAATADDDGSVDQQWGQEKEEGKQRQGREREG